MQIQILEKRRSGGMAPPLQLRREQNAGGIDGSTHINGGTIKEFCLLTISVIGILYSLVGIFQ